MPVIGAKERDPAQGKTRLSNATDHRTTFLTGIDSRVRFSPHTLVFASPVLCCYEREQPVECRESKIRGGFEIHDFGGGGAGHPDGARIHGPAIRRGAAGQRAESHHGTGLPLPRSRVAVAFGHGKGRKKHAGGGKNKSREGLWNCLRSRRVPGEKGTPRASLPLERAMVFVRLYQRVSHR